jgi:hypothetical protein
MYSSLDLDVFVDKQMDCYTSRFRYTEENLQSMFCKYKELEKGIYEYTAEPQLSTHNFLLNKHWYV